MKQSIIAGISALLLAVFLPMALLPPVDAAQPGGKALAREHLNDPVARRLVEKARALGCYSPFLFPMAHGFSSLTARLGGWMMDDSRWYHRVYWAGWQLRRLRTGQKPPVTL